MGKIKKGLWLICFGTAITIAAFLLISFANRGEDLIASLVASAVWASCTAATILLVSGSEGYAYIPYERGWDRNVVWTLAGALSPGVLMAFLMLRRRISRDEGA